MKTNEFKKLVNEAIENIEYENLEPMTETKKEFVSRFGAMAIFNYSRWCEINFESLNPCCNGRWSLRLCWSFLCYANT